jgi:predicted dehydrogenase
MHHDSLNQSAASRRSFIKTSALGVATGAMAGTLGMMQSVHAGTDDTIRVGLVGCGGRGTGAAVQVLTADKNVKLVALGDMFPEPLALSLATMQKNEKVGTQVDVPKERQFLGFDAYQKVIDAGVDAVLLASPPQFRPQHIEAAVKADKHVFAEKPVAVDAPGVRSVLKSVAEAKRKKLSVVSGFCFRYNPINMETVKRIHDGQIGDIITLHATRHGNNASRYGAPKPEWSDMERQLRNWYYYTWLSGDFYVEQFVHSLDMVSWVLKDVPPMRAYGVGGREMRDDKKYGNIFDHMAVVYEYADGKRFFAQSRQMQGCYNENESYIIGSQGEAQLIRGLITGKDKWHFKGEKKNMWQEEQIAFVKSIRSGQPINNGEYMAQSSLMGIMGRMACYTGGMIKWDEAMNSEENLSPKTYALDAPPPPPTVAKPGITRFS